MTKFCSSSSSGVQCGREAFACGAPSSKRLELKQSQHCDIVEFASFFTHVRTSESWMRRCLTVTAWKRRQRCGKIWCFWDDSVIFFNTFNQIPTISCWDQSIEPQQFQQFASAFIFQTPGSLAGSTQRMLPTMSRVVAPAEVEHTICCRHTANSLDSENQRILLTELKTQYHPSSMTCFHRTDILFTSIQPIPCLLQASRQISC